MANSLVQFRTDENTRIKATEICEKLGIDLQTYPQDMYVTSDSGKWHSVLHEVNRQHRATRTYRDESGKQDRGAERDIRYDT